MSKSQNFKLLNFLNRFQPALKTHRSKKNAYQGPESKNALIKFCIFFFFFFLLRNFKVMTHRYCFLREIIKFLVRLYPLVIQWIVLPIALAFILRSSLQNFL